jgi:hypothetical protein
LQVPTEREPPGLRWQVNPGQHGAGSVTPRRQAEPAPAQLILPPVIFFISFLDNFLPDAILFVFILLQQSYTLKNCQKLLMTAFRKPITVLKHI